MIVTQTKPINYANLYEQDFYLWLTTTANLLKEGNLREIDLENLIEEIESMGRRERQAIRSNLKILLMHLLKYQYPHQKRSKSWILTIFAHRDRVFESLKDSPSLVNYVPEIFEECYQFARQKAALETDLPLITFPLESPFSIEETLNCQFLPDRELDDRKDSD
jgi:hypothetical protein